MLLYATILIAVMTGSFILTLMAIAVFRGIRKSNNIRHRLIQHAESSPPRRPSDDFHDNTWLPLCTGIATLLAARIGRPLTEDENRILWKARSPLVLEVLQRELPTASPGEALALLHTLPSGLDRPDPTAWCERAISA